MFYVDISNNILKGKERGNLFEKWVIRQTLLNTNTSVLYYKFAEDSIEMKELKGNYSPHISSIGWFTLSEISINHSVDCCPNIFT